MYVPLAMGSMNSESITGGYRVYFIKQGEAVVILLAGGSKSTQQADIRQAIDLARNL
jgi:putative addiction module killer protein